jgi:dTDP-glucose 4,6-dehydratase
VLITRCSNNYGPYQFPEKVIPLFITNLVDGEKVPLYGDGLNVRDWIHVNDHCDALLAVLELGKPGEVYNIGADNELTNVELTHRILAALGKDESMIRPVKDRPGHDRRYAIDSAKIHGELGWSPAVRVEDGLADTIRWYVENEGWWRAIKSGEYLRYYELQYGPVGEGRA